MSEFTTTAEINLVVPRRELRSAREEVEDAMADIPVGLSASGGGGGGATNAAREQRRRRREFRWARQRTDDTESQLEVLENIEGELTEGGLGGGGGLGGDLLALGGEGAGIAADVGSTLVEALPAGIGSLVGTALGQRLSGGGGGGGQTSVERPPWVPLQTDRPDWIPIPVEDPGDGILPDVDIPDIPDLGFDDLPGPIGFDDPPTAPVGEPPTAPIEDPPTLEIEDAPMLEVEKPEWVPIQVEQPEITTRGGDARRRPFGPGERIGRAVDDVIVDPVAERTPASPPPGGQIAGRLFDRVNPLFGGLGRLPRPISESGRGGGGGGTTTRPVSATSGDVTVTVNADVQNAVQSAIEELRREQERQREQLRADLEQQIGDLERQITGGTGRRTGPSGSGFGR